MRLWVAFMIDIQRKDEITEHLSMNGYCFCTATNIIFVLEDDVAYMKTMLEDRSIRYTIL